MVNFKQPLRNSPDDIECINAIRSLCSDIVYNSGSGHFGSALGMAPIAHLLFSKFLRSTSADDQWINRDRFVLSNGHSCALLYSILHLLGFNISIEDLKRFRRLNSCTPGHPEVRLTHGVDASTGALGEGVASAVGMAIASKHIAACFNKSDFGIIDHNVFVFCGDGDMQEGVSSEACSLAGHLGLDNLILIYDQNNSTIDGSTDLSFTENVEQRFKSYNWNTFTIKNGDEDYFSMELILSDIMNSIRNKPTLILVRNTIGFSTPNAGTKKCHGSFPKGIQYEKINPHNKNGIKDIFKINENVKKHYQKVSARNKVLYSKWKETFKRYSLKYPLEANEFQRIFVEKRLPDNFDGIFESVLNGGFFDVRKLEGAATRTISVEILNAIASKVPELIGGSADLSDSTKVTLKKDTFFTKSNPSGRKISFGVREHSMFAIGNGIASYNLIPFTSTFLNFSLYGFPAIRSCAMDKYRQIFIFSHDSISLGEDGPSHQPIEALPSLRSIPNLLVIRPFNTKETSMAYKTALKNNNGPTAIILSRQNLSHVPTPSKHLLIPNLGGYFVFPPKIDKNMSYFDLLLVASGSEVCLAYKTAVKLNSEGIINVAVCSIPSLEMFKRQTLDFRRSLIPIGPLIVSIEAAAVGNWAEFSHFSVFMDSFGASGRFKEIEDKFGFSVEKVVLKCKEFINEVSKIIEKERISRKEVLGILRCQR